MDERLNRWEVLFQRALVRPGRYFATVRTRALDRGEAVALAARLGVDVALPTGLRSITLAAFYKLLDDERAAAPPALI